MGLTINVVEQPAQDDWVVAYRPIGFSLHVIGTTNNAQPMYCDIYIGGTYYKTMEALTPLLYFFGAWYYFDIQDAVQEYLTTRIPDENHTAFQLIKTGSGIETQSFVNVQCRFRGSSFDAYGVLTPEAPVPVQATSWTGASPGGGISTNSFFVLNTTIQHKDNDILENHLKRYRINNAYTQVIPPATRVYALSHMPRCRIYNDNIGQLPFLIMTKGFVNGAAGSASSTWIRVSIYRWNINNGLIGGNGYAVSDINVNDNSVYYVATGVPQINAMVANNGSQPIDWSSVYYYQVIVWDVVANRPAMISPRYYLEKDPGPIQKRTRIWFRNYLGHFDQVNFIERDDSFNTKSSKAGISMYSPASQPAPGNRSWAGSRRQNVRSNVQSQVGNIFEEDEMEWLKELFNTSEAFIEVVKLPDSYFPNASVYKGQFPFDGTLTNELIPINLLDGTMLPVKNEDRWYYDVSITYEMSNDDLNLR